MTDDPSAPPWIVIRLDPTELDNPDADLRYLIPDTIVERSAGVLRSLGYEYEGEQPIMAIYLGSDDPDSDIQQVRAVLESETFIGNRLIGRFNLTIQRDDDEAPNAGSGFARPRG